MEMHDVFPIWQLYIERPLFPLGRLPTITERLPTIIERLATSRHPHTI